MSLLVKVSTSFLGNSLRASSLRFYSAASTAPYKHLLTEVRGTNKNVGIVQLNRPKALNALCAELMTELADAVQAFNHDPAIHCLVLTGSQRAFAAGADIKEMQNKVYAAYTVLLMNYITWF